MKFHCGKPKREFKTANGHILYRFGFSQDLSGITSRKQSISSEMKIHVNTA